MKRNVLWHCFIIVALFVVILCQHEETTNTIVNHDNGQEHDNNQDTEKEFPAAATAGIVVAVVIIFIFIAVVLFLVHRKRQAKHPPIDDACTRNYSDNMFIEDNSDVIMRTNSLYSSSGADSSGYYQKPTVVRSSNEIRVPTKELFRGNLYSSDRSRNNGHDIEISTISSPEEASFVY